LLGDTFDHFISNMRELRQMPESLRSDEEFVLKIRDSFNNLCELALDTLTSAQVTDILRRGLIDANSGFDVVINDTKTSELYKFAAEATSCLRLHLQGIQHCSQGQRQVLPYGVLCRCGWECV